MHSHFRWAIGLLVGGVGFLSFAQSAHAVVYDSPLAYSGKNKTGMTTGEPLVLIKEVELPASTSANTSTLISKSTSESFGNGLWGAGYAAKFNAKAERLVSPSRRRVSASGEASAWGRILEVKKDIFKATFKASATSDGSGSASYDIYVLGIDVGGKKQSSPGELTISTSVGSSTPVSPPVGFVFMIGPVPVEVKGQVYLSKGFGVSGSIKGTEISARFSPYARLYGQLDAIVGLDGVAGVKGTAKLTLIKAELPFDADAKWTATLRRQFNGQYCTVDRVDAGLASYVGLGTLDGSFDISAFLGPFTYTERVAEWKAPFTTGFYMLQAVTEASSAPYACKSGADILVPGGELIPVGPLFP